MVRLIVGENAAGKTLYLKEVLQKYMLNNVITNTVNDSTLIKEKFNSTRVNILRNTLKTADIKGETGLLNIACDDIELSSQFLELLSMVCKDRDILILDEPCFGLTPGQKCIIVDFFREALQTFKDAYIVTHYESLLGLLIIPGFEAFTVNTDNKTLNTEVIKISMEEADEIID